MYTLIPGIGVCAADSVIKEHVEDMYNVGESVSINKCIDIQLHHNYGSAGNFGAGNPKFVRCISVLLTIWCGALFVISLTLGGSKLLRTGLGLLLGGAFSNTYDRMKKGYVTDYLRFKKGPRFIRRFIWNISDFSIIIGSLLAVING